MPILTPTRRELKNVALHRDPSFDSKLVRTEFRKRFARWLEDETKDERSDGSKPEIVAPYALYEIRSSTFKPSERKASRVRPYMISPHDPDVRPANYFWIEEPVKQAHYGLFFDSFSLLERGPGGSNQVDETRLVLFKPPLNLDSLIAWEGGLSQIEDDNIEAEMKVENYWIDDQGASRIHKLVDIYLWTRGKIVPSMHLLHRFLQYVATRTDPTAEQPSSSTVILQASRSPRPHSDAPKTPGPSALPSNGKYASWPVPEHPPQSPLR